MAVSVCDPCGAAAVSAPMIGERRANDIAYVKACWEHWARWRCGAGSGGAISSTGKLMQGMRSTLCPVCRGTHDDCPLCFGVGRISAKLDPTPRPRPAVCPVCAGEREFCGKDCFRCHGKGMIEIIDLKINPAGIRSTKYVGGRGIGDVVAATLEDLVLGWRELDATVWLNRVAIREYLHNGTQDDKARRLRISRSFYSRNLREVHWRAERALIEVRI